jgi:hypothetical protein
MEWLFELGKLLVIAFVLTDLGLFVSELLPTPKNRVLGVITLVLRYWLSCSKCFTFWLSLIYTGDLFTSALAALIINYLKELEYKLKNKTKL